MFGTEPLEELAIPDGTTVEEHALVTDGDVLVGGQTVVDLGVRGGSVIAGERVRFGGDLEAEGDCRLDMWCTVDGNVLVGEDAYLGERVQVSGELIVSGDLDIGDDVDIERGFEANGWIVIRNPMPTVVFLFVYLSQLLRIGEEEAAMELADELLDEDRTVEPVTIPRGGRVSDDAWRVSTPAVIGDECRLHGNIRATDVRVGADSELFGSLRAKGDIVIGPGTVVHGDVTTRDGDVEIDVGAAVRGDVACENCVVSDLVEIDGTIRAREGLSIVEPTLGSGDLDPAIVPLEHGDLESSADETTSDEIQSAVVPLEESSREWNETEAERTSRNGSGDDDVSELIAEAEEG